MAVGKTKDNDDPPLELPQEIVDQIEAESLHVRAPEGGYGWIILLASFLCNVIVDGTCFAFGIYYMEFLDFYHGNKGKTAWVGSVLNGTYMVMGKISYSH